MPEYLPSYSQVMEAFQIIILKPDDPGDPVDLDNRCRCGCNENITEENGRSCEICKHIMCAAPTMHGEEGVLLPGSNICAVCVDQTFPKSVPNKSCLCGCNKVLGEYDNRCRCCRGRMCLNSEVCVMCTIKFFPKFFIQQCTCNILCII